LICDVTAPAPAARHTENSLLLRARSVFTELLLGNALIKYATILIGVCEEIQTTILVSLFLSVGRFTQNTTPFP
jgi:hypothetical protein